MNIHTGQGTAKIDLKNSIGSYLRNAGFHEEVITEIKEALEWKSEFEQYKKELGITA